MNFDKFANPPASDETLSYLIDKVFEPCFKNSNVTFFGFPGNGKPAQIKYLIRNLNLIPSYPKNHVFSLLDFDVLSTFEDTAFRDAISFMASFFEFDRDAQMFIGKTLAQKRVTLDSYTKLLHYLITLKGLHVTVILDNFDLAYGNNVKAGELREAAYLIRKINPMFISYMFWCFSELSEVSAENLGRLCEIFMENILWSGEFLMDEGTVVRLAANQEKWKGYKFNEDFVKKAKEASAYDLTVLKIIVVKAIDNPEFEKAFIDEKNIAKLYELIGKDVLNTRFTRIIDALQTVSLECLLNNYSNPTDFIKNTGVVKVAADGRPAPMNGLFDHFVKSNTDLIKNKIESVLKNVKPSTEALVLKEKLAAQEFLLYSLLSGREGQTVTRDEAAKAIWGEAPGQTYSDWALDKLVSTLRAKLKSLKHSKTIKTLKGKGFVYL